MLAWQHASRLWAETCQMHALQPTGPCAFPCFMQGLSWSGAPALFNLHVNCAPSLTMGQSYSREAQQDLLASQQVRMPYCLCANANRQQVCRLLYMQILHELLCPFSTPCGWSSCTCMVPGSTALLHWIDILGVWMMLLLQRAHRALCASCMGTAGQQGCVDQHDHMRPS